MTRQEATITTTYSHEQGEWIARDELEEVEARAEMRHHAVYLLATKIKDKRMKRFVHDQ